MSKWKKNMGANKRQLIAIILIASAGVISSMLMFWITAFGPGVSPDSIVYIGTARGFLAGQGFFYQGQPMTHYPPIYPLLLAIVGISQHGDVLQASRLLSVFFFGTNVALLGLAVFICTERSLSATVFVLFMFLTSAPIISIHSMAWSEALFITFTLIAFIILSLHIVRPSLFLLLVASLSVGCAMATRYIGVTLLPPTVFALLFLSNRPIKQKIGDTLLAITIASLPLTSWIIRNMITADTLTNRTTVIHMFGLNHAIQLMVTLYDFILPINFSGWMKALQLGIIAALILVLLILLYRKNFIKRNVNTISGILTIICIIFFLTYISFLVISVSFFDAHTPLDARIILPAYLVFIIAGFSLAWSLFVVFNRKIIRDGFILIVCISILINSARAVGVAINIHNNGSGYNSLKWNNSETISSIMTLAKDVSMYSNGPDVIHFYTRRRVSMIPDVTLPNTLKPNLDFEEQLQTICNEVEKGEAVVVYLNGITWRWYLPSLQDFEAKCDMPVLERLDDGIIYGQ